ncbi:hypothetical protein MSAN_00945000 [Mycena sanguinolenta]|uniref:Uncharacterized protein n=1 Tax=Mycena sanguinolenta TaxID=230812 RepID=A0A8H7D956_9AGAR|nr:hypothetical protein MSAN_00945000 [Mycena sanguinolenta]
MQAEIAPTLFHQQRACYPAIQRTYSPSLTSEQVLALVALDWRRDESVPIVRSGPCAAHCAKLPPLPPAFASSHSDLTLPVLSITLLSSPAFAILHPWMYTCRLDAALDSLPPGVLPRVPVLRLLVPLLFSFAWKSVCAHCRPADPPQPLGPAPFQRHLSLTLADSMLDGRRVDVVRTPASAGEPDACASIGYYLPALFSSTLTSPHHAASLSFSSFYTATTLYSIRATN